MNEENKVLLFKPFPSSNYSSKLLNSSYLEIKHLKTIDKIHNMRYIQYENEMSSCYPYPKISNSTRIILKDLQNSKQLQVSLSPYYQRYAYAITHPLINHSKLRTKASRRVLNLFLKEAINQYGNDNKEHLERINQQRKGLTENNIHSNNTLYRLYRRNISNSSDSESNMCYNGSQLSISGIAESRLRLNKVMKSHYKMIKGDKDKSMHWSKNLFRSKTEYKRKNRDKTNISLSPIRSNTSIKPSPLINLYQIAFPSNNDNAKIKKEQFKTTTAKDMRLRDLENLFPFSTLNNVNSNSDIKNKCPVSAN